MEGWLSTSSGGSEDRMNSHERNWGDDIEVGWSNAFRIGFLNVGSLMVDSYADLSDEVKIGCDWNYRV